MHKLEKKEPIDHNKFLNPSFSSTLLDQIYRSIDEGERKSTEMRFYRETTYPKKQSRSNREELQTKQKDKAVLGIRQRFGDTDQDVLFFSSTSISSDSSGFSSSDTESRASRASCFAPPRPKPVRTSMSFRSEKHGTRMFDGFCQNSNVAIHDDESLIRSKSRALKIYNNIKKVKQPISPGGKLTNFLHSLFTSTNNAKKTRSRYEDVSVERKVKSCQASTCSSVSSFSRSCLSKTPSSEREKLCNGVKRTVRFYPVSVIVDEDSRECGHKHLYGEEGKSKKSVMMKKNNEEEEFKFPAFEKKNNEEFVARGLLGEYRFTQKKKDLVLKDLPLRVAANDEQEEDDDDVASCASSDLFELDHLAVLGNGKYCEELPVYETTNVSTNRAIANGLIV